MPDYESGGGGSNPSGSTSGRPARRSPWRSRKARLLPKEQVARSSRAGDTRCSHYGRDVLSSQPGLYSRGINGRPKPGVDLRRPRGGGPGLVPVADASELVRGGFQCLGARQRPSGVLVARCGREQPGGVTVQQAATVERVRLLVRDLRQGGERNGLAGEGVRPGQVTGLDGESDYVGEPTAADPSSAAEAVAAGRRDRRRPNPPATASSTPPASVPSHGASPGPGLGAVPPNPVAAPPFGESVLPAASVRLSILSPEVPSSTTRVCTEPAASFTAMAACPPAALNVTVGEPGRTDWYDEAAPKASSLARTSDPTLTVTWGCFTDAWMTLTSAFDPAAAAI